MATSESRSWWSPIIITLIGFLVICTPKLMDWAAYFNPLLNAAVLIVGIILTIVILIQRGKGGGLAGAFGGVGGSSPFGSRAGDAFTRFTISLATLWLWLVLIQVKAIQIDAQNPENQPIPVASRR